MGELRTLPLPPSGAATSDDERVVADGLVLALAATRALVAWHAGLLDGDAAMRTIERAQRELRAQDGAAAPPAG